MSLGSLLLKLLLPVTFLVCVIPVRAEVLFPPTISAPCATFGAPVTLSATLPEGQASSWQWFKEGVPLQDETNSSLTLSSFGPAGIGWYSASASNGSEFATSRPLMLLDCQFFERDWIQPRPRFASVAPVPAFASVKHLNGVFIAVGATASSSPYSPGVYYSWDGERWDPFLQLEWPPGFGSYTDVEYGNNRFVFAKPDSVLILEGNVWGARDVDYTVSAIAAPMLISSLAFGNGVFVAAGTSNTVDGYLAVSADGKTWNKQPVGQYVTLNKVIFANDHFIASGNGKSPSSNLPTAYTFVSSDGEEWQVVARTNTLAGPVSFAAGRFLAGAYVADLNGSFLQSSLDGLDWRNDVPIARNACLGPQFAAGNSHLVGIHTLSEYHLGCPDTYRSDTRFLLSTDGVSWTTSGRTIALSLNSICYANRKFIAAGRDGVIAQSSSGTNWTIVSDGRALRLNGVYCQSNLCLALGDGIIGVSTNGAPWAFRHVTNEWDIGFNAPGSNSLWTAAYGNGRWVVSGPKITLLSSNLEQWESMPGAPLYQGIPMASLAFGNGTFAGISFGSPGAPVSGSGTNWYYSLGSNIRGLRKILFANDVFVAVGTNGAIYTSTNGWQWTNRPSGITEDLISIAYGYDRSLGSNSFLAVSAQGGCYSSGDGSSWFKLAQLSWGEVTCVANAFETFFIANATGAIRPLSASAPVSFGTAPVRGMAASDTTFVTVGEKGLRVYQRTFPPADLIIAASPASRTVLPGVTFQLEVTAYGRNGSRRNPQTRRDEPALKYQWTRNGEIIPDATNSFLLFKEAAEHDSGDYAVMVSDGSRAVTSAVATVLVTQPHLVATVEGAMLNVSFSGIPGQRYLIQHRADLEPSTMWKTITNVAGTTLPTIWRAPISSEPRGFYRVTSPP